MQPSWPTRNWYLFGLTLVHARDQHGRPSPLRRRCRPSAAIGSPAFAPARSRGLLRPELVIAWCLFWAPDPRRLWEDRLLPALRRRSTSLRGEAPFIAIIMSTNSPYSHYIVRPMVGAGMERGWTNEMRMANRPSPKPPGSAQRTAVRRQPPEETGVST